MDYQADLITKQFAVIPLSAELLLVIRSGRKKPVAEISQ